MPPKHAEIELGDDAVLECEVDSNPTAYIVWRRKEDPGATIIGRDRQLVVPKVSAGKLGIYTCSASMPDFNEIEAEFHILKKGKWGLFICGMQKLLREEKRGGGIVKRRVPTETGRSWKTIFMKKPCNV